MKTLEKNRFNSYHISKNNKSKLDKFIEEAKKYNEEFENIIELTKNLESYQSNINYYKDINKSLNQKNSDLVSKINKKDKENINLKNNEEFYKSLIKSLKEDKLDLIKFVSDKIHIENKAYKYFANDLYSKGIFSKAKYKLSLRPLINYSKQDINNALSKINNEMDKFAEDFYTNKNNLDLIL